MTLLLILTFVLNAPVWIFLIYHFIGWDFYGFSAKTLAFRFVLSITVVLCFMGYFKTAFNSSKGIKSYVYSVVEDEVYFSGDKLKEADAKTFHQNYKPTDAINPDYTFDKSHVFYLGQVVEGADPSAFANIAHRKTGHIKKYWSDTKAVYYKGEKIQNADPKNFVVYEYDKAKDSKKHFLRDIALDVDYDSFKWLSRQTDYYGFYGSDKEHICCDNKKILLMADPESFKSKVV